MARMGHDSERAAMIYQHVARGADQLITNAHTPLPALRLRPHRRLRMTRGRRGSLGLRRRALSSPPPGRFIPAHASSSRSQRAMWPTTALTLSDLPRTVRGRPLAYVAVVTHLVTHPPKRPGGCDHGPRTPATDRPGDA